jgi:hypothetical protein
VKGKEVETVEATFPTFTEDIATTGRYDRRNSRPEDSPTFKMSY